MPTGPVWKNSVKDCDGGTLFNNSCYEMVKSSNWFDAVDQCKSLGGNLVSISSQDEAKFITGNVTNVSSIFWLQDTGHFSYGELVLDFSGDGNNSSFNGTLQTIVDFYVNISGNASAGNATTNGTLGRERFLLGDVSGNGTSSKIVRQDASFFCPVFNKGYIVGSNCSAHQLGVCELPGTRSVFGIGFGGMEWEGGEWHQVTQPKRYERDKGIVFPGGNGIGGG